MISLRALSCPSGLCDVLDSDVDILGLLHTFVAFVGLLIELLEEQEK